MTDALVARRTVLRTGLAIAAPVALGGLLPWAAAAAPRQQEATLAPIQGSLVGWLTVGTDQQAMLRVMALDSDGRGARQVAARLVASDPSRKSLRAFCQSAQGYLVETAARSWGVPSDECVVGTGRIAHEASGRTAGYAVWVDVA